MNKKYYQGTTSKNYYYRVPRSIKSFPSKEDVQKWLNEIRKMRKYSKTLHLSLKKEWYNMIESGIKTEEYREIKPFWCKRLIHDYDECMEEFGAIIFDEKNFKEYNRIKFTYGYTKKYMVFECNGIDVGIGNSEWGAPNKPVFIIKLGKRVE